METNTTKNSLFIGVFMVGLIVGGTVYGIADPKLPSSLSNTKQGYQSGFEASKQLINESEIGALLRKNPINEKYSLSGTVQAIEGDRITVDVGMADLNENEAMRTRKVRITASTTLVRVRVKSIEAFETEVATYRESFGVIPANKIIAPERFTKTPVAISSVKVGDSVSVVSFQNILTSPEFLAKEFQIIVKESAQ